MSRVHGKDLTTLTLAGQSLKVDTISIDWEDAVDTEDTTTIGDQAQESTPGLRVASELNWSLMYDNTATTGTFAFLTGKIGAAASSALVISDGVRTTTDSVHIIKVAGPINVAEMRKIEVTYKKNAITAYS